MTWSRLLSLLAAARRPLVVFDFETAGLGGAPPVEYALAYWAPWAPPEMDATSVAARRVSPPGLTYATTARIDPGCAIDPDAQAVHGISRESLKGCKRYDDLEVVAFFQALARGDATAGEGPAVWCGHNAAEADVPWAQKWGYLPRVLDAFPSRLAVVDTRRVFTRLSKAHDFPLSPDAILPGARVPCVGTGLSPYAASLKGLHVALTGELPTVAHAALADVQSTAWCLMAFLELWQPVWPAAVQGEDPQVALDAMLTALDAPPPGMLSWDGWVRVRPDGSHVWGDKAQKPGPGRLLNVDPPYASWVASLPSSPTGENGKAWCSDTTRAALSVAATGRARAT